MAASGGHPPAMNIVTPALEGRFPFSAADTLQVTHHLILVHRRNWQAAEDWHAIARHVRDIDPRIETFVVDWSQHASYTRRRAAGKPTLIVSPSPLGPFQPRRGMIYQGRRIEKTEQLALLEQAGVAVPRTALLTPGLTLDPADWGDVVIVKPSHIPTSSRGAGIHLMRTERVRYRTPKEYPPGHPGRAGPIFIQQFIDTGDRIQSCRVLTLFGEPLYCIRDLSLSRRVSLHAPDDEIEGAPIATQQLDCAGTFVDDEDVLAIARAADAAIPDVPLKGCDVLREAGTGKLYVLEVNPGGNTWHFSSAMLAEERAENGPEFERKRIRQFDALRTSARILAARTMQEAV